MGQAFGEPLESISRVAGAACKALLVSQLTSVNVHPERQQVMAQALDLVHFCGKPGLSPSLLASA